jgi:hypothetical protein
MASRWRVGGKMVCREDRAWETDHRQNQRGKSYMYDLHMRQTLTSYQQQYPDPTQHWAMLVGEYAHQLWMDENFDVIYINARIKREE